MLWEIRCRKTGTVVMEAICSFVEVRIILRTLEFAKQAPMEAVLLRNENNLETPKNFIIYGRMKLIVRDNAKEKRQPVC
jgi:hypothetical protein